MSFLRVRGEGKSHALSSCRGSGDCPTVVAFEDYIIQTSLRPAEAVTVDHFPWVYILVQLVYYVDCGNRTSYHLLFLPLS